MSAPTTAAELHETHVDFSTRLDWDCTPEVMILDAHDKVTLAALVIDGNPVDYLSMAVARIAHDSGEKVKAVSFMSEAWMTTAAKQEDIESGNFTPPSQSPDRIEIRQVMTWGADGMQASVLRRDTGQWNHMDDTAQGRLPDIGAMFQMFLMGD